VGHPKSLTRNKVGGESMSVRNDSIDIFSHMVDSSDMVVMVMVMGGEGAPLTR